MKNKLLVTLAASSILLSPTAYSVEYNINYLGNNKFKLGDEIFNSYGDVYNFLITDDAMEYDIKEPSKEDKKAFVKDILNNNTIRRDVLSNTFTGPEKNLTDQFIKTVKMIYDNVDQEEKDWIESNFEVLKFLENPTEYISYVLDNIPDFTQEAYYELTEVASANLNDPSQTQENIDIKSNYALLKPYIFTPETPNNIINDLFEDIDDNYGVGSRVIKENLKKLSNILINNITRGNESLSEIQQARVKEIKELVINQEEFSSFRDNTLQEILLTIQEDVEELEEDGDEVSKNRLISFFNEIKDLFLATDIKDANTVPEVQKSDSAISEGMLNSLMVSREIVDSRINNFSAVAAGDFMDTKGVWMQGSYTSGEQKAHGNAPGYKLSQKGFTIGVDAGDDNMLGLAYSFYANDIKGKTKNKNTTDLSSHIATIYGKFNVTNEVFVKGQGQFGKSYIKKERNTGTLANNKAKAETDATILSAKFDIGYDVAINEKMHLLPTIGLSYANVDVKGYKEKGDGLNRSVGKRTSNKASGLAGISAVYSVDINEDTKLWPEVHANLDYAFKTKNSATMVTVINGIDPIATPSEKLAKTYYNIGGSLKSIHKNNIELTIGYDLGLSKKFISHTGAMKLRVNM